MKGKTQKGITLVALIITIIVLLILAVVAISAVSGDGILRHAQNSADQYNAAQIKENTILSNYLDYINKHDPNGGENPPAEVLERIYYVADGEWEDEYVTSESGVPENATITAKFYKTNIPFQPSLPERWGSEVTFEKKYAYKLVIDGQGTMPAISDMDNEIIAAWGYEILAAQEQDFNNIMYYLTEVEINGVSNVGTGAFMFACCLNTCSLDDSVSKINTYAFMECAALQSINLEGVVDVETYAFATCSSLANITISDDVTNIGEAAFSGCNSLANIITIPSDETNIGADAFSDCSDSLRVKINETATDIKDMTNYPWGADGKIYDKDNNLVQ